MLTFEDLTPGNWHRFEKPILQSELFYPEFIRTSREEFIEVLLDGDYIAKVVKLDSRYIGNAIGYSLTQEDIKDHGFDWKPENSRMLYLFNFVIEPAYRGKGYGQRLLLEFIKSANEIGYEKLVGHFRRNWSLPMIKKLGAIEIGIHSNWENTGEDYIICELDLRRVVVPVFT